MKKTKSRKWWRFKERIKHLRYDMSNAYTRAYRWVLRIPHPYKTDLEWHCDEPNERGFIPVNSKRLSQQVANSKPWFHGTPRREHYMDKLGRFIFYNGIYSWPGNIRNWFRHKLNLFVLKRTRKLTWDTHHYVSRTKESHIDGYIEFEWGPFKRSMVLDVCSPKAMYWDAVRSNGFKEDSPKVKWTNIDTYGSWGFPTLMMFNDKNEYLDLDRIEEMIVDWYMKRYEYCYRHWTSKEVIEVEIKPFSYNDQLCNKCGYDLWEGEGCQCPKPEKVDKSTGA